MANPRWFMDAGDEAFSIVGKLFKKGDPAADAMLRVLARRAKSAPDAEKFYDPAQELMEKVPATSWKQALDRMEEIRVQTDKDADVVLPWKWEGGRADDIPAIVDESQNRNLMSDGYQNARATIDTSTTPDFIKQQRRQAKSFREKSTGEMRPAKPFSREFVRLLDDTKEAYNAFGLRGVAPSQRYIANRARLNFSILEQLDVPREWTGEAEVAAIKRARLSAEAEIDGQIARGTKLTPKQRDAQIKYITYKNYSKSLDSTIPYAIGINKEKLATMTNRQRAMFFELLGDWEGDFQDLADAAIALAQ